MRSQSALEATDWGNRMDENRPSGTDAPEVAASSDTTWLIGVRPRCAHCDRLAATVDRNETPLCARHATIFLTADQIDDR